MDDQSSSQNNLTGEFKTTRAKHLSEYQTQQLSGLGSGALNTLAKFTNRSLMCSHCKRCTERCEVLNGPGLDIGEISRTYRRIMSLPAADRVAATIEEVQARPELYIALRQCCFCGYCTSACQAHQFAPDVMRNWRELFSIAGYMPPEDSRMVMVDDQWHIFSAYRAIYEIGYPEFLQLPDVAEQGRGIIDTVLFPGCSLVSYTPELVHAVGEWLNTQGFSWALSLDCCGSPLMSAGLFERAEGLRLRIVDQLRKAGVKQIITVCPGCGEELADNMPEDIDIIPLPELLFHETRKAKSAVQAGFSPLNDAPASYTVFDSCHDRRDNRHGLAIRQLLAKYLPNADLREMDNRRKNTLCCGAGGAVAGYDDVITARRIAEVLFEARETGAEALVSMCPTCTYTIAQANLSLPPEEQVQSYHYLELLFGIKSDWAAIFGRLESMWVGEYGPWLTETFFS